MNERNSIIGKIDWLTLLIYLALVLIGWFSIFSARYNEAHPSIFDMSQVYGKQLIWTVLSSFSSTRSFSTLFRFGFTSRFWSCFS